MSTMSVTPESRVLLRGVSWETYERLLEDLGDAGPRLTYADGELEIVSPSFRHERYAGLLGRAIEAMTEELGIPILSGRSTTFRLRRQKIGLEPDECYWVQNEARVRGKHEIDLTVDPAPDLAIEAEVSHSALDKLALFARLGFGEVWRFEGERLAIHARQPSGNFAQQPASRCFPFLPMAEFLTQVAAAWSTDETSWIRAFRRWVRDSLRTGT